MCCVRTLQSSTMHQSEANVWSTRDCYFWHRLSAIRTLSGTFLLPKQETKRILTNLSRITVSSAPPTILSMLDYAAAGTRINPSAPSSPLPSHITPVVHIISCLVIYLFLVPHPPLLFLMYFAHFVLPCQAHYTAYLPSIYTGFPVINSGFSVSSRHPGICANYPGF